MTICDDSEPRDHQTLAELALSIERDLLDRHGPLIADDALRVALGYRSMEAFRQAIARKTVPVAVFGIPDRRGKFALAKDVARWLAKLSIEASEAHRKSAPDD